MCLIVHFLKIEMDGFRQLELLRTDYVDLRIVEPKL